MSSSLSKKFLVVFFIVIYLVNVYFGWPIIQISGVRIAEYVDLAAIIKSGNLCSGKLDFWGFLDLSQRLPEDCGGFIYGRPLLALLAMATIPLTWTTPIAILLGLATAIVIALTISLNIGSGTARVLLAALAIFSPGVFLLFERANFDLLMILGVLLATFLLSKGRFFTGLFVAGLTAVFKYYTLPLLLIAPFLFGRDRKQILFGSAFAASISLYAVWDYSQLPRVPGDGYVQFGSGVLSHYFTHLGLDVSSMFSIGFGILVPLVLGIFVFRRSKLTGNSLTLGSLFKFTSLNKSLFFTTVSSVFIASYFAGLNFDYRLVFLAIPGVILLQSATGPKVNLYFLQTSLLVALWGSAALGNSLSFGSDQLRFLVVGLFQLAGDTMVFVWTGLLIGLVARLVVGSDLIRKVALRRVTL